MNEVDLPVRLRDTTLGERRHICAFFPTRDDEYRVLLPFVMDGIDRGEKALHIVDAALRADHLGRLEDSGIDVRGVEASGQLEVRTWEDTYLRGGRFDQMAMLALVEQSLRDARDQGFPRVRLLAHMEWALQDRPGVGDLVEYEARANAVLAGYDDPVVCVYDRARFGTELAMDVVRVHPTVISAGRLLDNRLFVPPETLLGELAARAGATGQRSKRLTAQCVHCHHTILAGVERIGNDEASALLEHMRVCRRAVPIDRRRDEELGRLLRNYDLTDE